MSSLFREVNASHYIPYHLILKWGSIYHRYKANHHYLMKKNIDDLNIKEMVIDWECARYTKPDKPLNARETLFKYGHKLPTELWYKVYKELTNIGL